MPFYARRSKQDKDKLQLLRDHIIAVASLTEQYLQPWNIPPAELAELGRLAGLLHDLGKYSREFQLKLVGKYDGSVFHQLPGADLVTKLLARQIQPKDTDSDPPLRELWLPILAHHGGLCDASPASYKHEGAFLPDTHQCAVAMLKDTGINLTARLNKLKLKNLPSMLATRILLGALVCADWEDSMNFEGERYDKPPTPDWHEVYHMLLQKRAEAIATSSASQEISNARERVWEYAGELAQRNPGIHTLIAPTGTGKTLAMLRFALEHAIKHNLRRIIIATPFLSITDQWDSIIHSIVNHTLIFVDHSMVQREDEEEDSLAYRAHKYYQAWYHPVVVTTFNQLLESLFERRCSDVRKLPQLAKSVILLDEFHTIPVELVDYTLRALRYISEWGGSSILLASATPPHENIIQNDPGTLSIDNPLDKSVLRATSVVRLRPRRTFHAINDLKAISMDELEELVLNEYQTKSVCVVLNFTADAASLANRLVLRNIPVYHLSTRMCPAHRQHQLNEIRSKLIHGDRFVLVSTQCIEAGVDVDFPVLFRALAPLTSIIQAAGRCNRHGRLSEGKVYLFHLDTDDDRNTFGRLRWLSDDYLRGTNAVAYQLARHAISLDELESEETLNAYLDSLLQKSSYPLLAAIQDYNFHSVREIYRLIRNRPKCSIIIPAGFRYDKQEPPDFLDIRPRDIHGYRRYMVDVFVKSNESILEHCEPVRGVEGVYILRNDNLYNDLLGLVSDKVSWIVV